MEILTRRFIRRLTGLELPCSHFSHLFVDEAAQATEPETWIPISLLVGRTLTSTQVVLSGDPKQLGPIVQSKLVKHLLGSILFTVYYFTELCFVVLNFILKKP